VSASCANEATTELDENILTGTSPRVTRHYQQKLECATINLVGKSIEIADARSRRSRRASLSDRTGDRPKCHAIEVTTTMIERDHRVVVLAFVACERSQRA
jgi:hypothetical protein